MNDTVSLYLESGSVLNGIPVECDPYKIKTAYQFEQLYNFVCRVLEKENVLLDLDSFGVLCDLRHDIVNDQKVMHMVLKADRKIDDHTGERRVIQALYSKASGRLCGAVLQIEGREGYFVSIVPGAATISVGIYDRGPYTTYESAMFNAEVFMGGDLSLTPRYG